jgi:hypothetical protein
VIPQLIFVIKVLFTLEAKVVVQTLLIMRMKALFGLEDLDVTRRQKILVNIPGDDINNEEY